MDKFIACQLEQRFEVLILSGEPTRKELQDAYDTLFYAYCDELQDATSKHCLELVREINAGVYRILRIESCVEILKYDTSMVATEVLRAEGYDLPEEYTAEDLDMIIQLLANDKTDLEILQAELEEIKAGQSGEPLTHEYYSKAFYAISKDQGFKVRQEETTVREYTTAIKLLRSNSKTKTTEDERTD